MKTLLAMFLALPIGTAFAGEDSTHRLHSTGPEWYQVTSALQFQDADSEPSSIVMAVNSSNYRLERYDYPS